MQLVNRKTVTRVSALILVLMLILSGVSCFAASFKKSQAGVSYGGAQFKLGALHYLGEGVQKDEDPFAFNKIGIQRKDRGSLSEDTLCMGR